MISTEVLDEGDLIDTIIDRCDTFLDMHPNGEVLCGGDLNRLDLDCLSTSSGLVPMVNFATRGTSILDNCLTNPLSCSTTPYVLKP